jgi:hypothetical protein
MSDTLVTVNEQDGFQYLDREDAKRAVGCDLGTLPLEIQGTNCGNCKYARASVQDRNIIECAHPAVRLPVTARMCCAFWDSIGFKRAWE